MAASYRVVGGPQDFSDDTQHTITLSDNVDENERIVILGGTSVDTQIGTIGSATDDSGNTYAIDQQAYGGAFNAANALSAHCDTALGIGDGVTIHVTPGWHGMSPFWLVLAINSGDARPMVKDVSAGQASGNTQTPTTPEITTASGPIVVLGFFAGTITGSPGNFTPGTGWSEICDTGPGTESDYNIVAQGRVETGPWTGRSNGTVSVFSQLEDIIVAYKAQDIGYVKTGAGIWGG